MDAVLSGRFPLCLHYRVGAPSNTMILKQWKTRNEPSSKAGEGWSKAGQKLIKKKSKTKSWFFETINKIDKLLAKLNKRKMPQFQMFRGEREICRNAKPSENHQDILYFKKLCLGWEWW